MHKIFTLILIAVCFNGYAQTEASMSLTKKADIIDVVPLGEDGFIVKSGAIYAGREKEIQLTSYRADLSQRWTVQIPKATNSLLANDIVVSPGAAYTYYVNTSQFSTVSKKATIHIARIDSTGKKEEIDYKMATDIKTIENVALFADDDNLYMLRSMTSKNSKKDVKKKGVGRSEGKIMLFIMNKAESELRAVDTDLKLTSDQADADLFVEYLGHDDTYIYLAKKNVSLSENQITYDVVMLDKSGKTVETSQFMANIDSKMVPAVNYRNTLGAVTYNNDYDVVITQNGRTTTTTYYANAGSFGCAQLDVNNGYFYIYGLSTGKKTPKKKDNGKNKGSIFTTKLESNAGGIYVCKFDFSTGELISKNEIPFNKSILADNQYAKPSLFINRSIWLNVVDSETVRIGGASNLSRGVHVTVLNTTSGKTEYIGKDVKHRKSSGMYHRTFIANALVTKLDASKETINYINQFPDFRAKDFSVFGICLGDKTVLARNYAFSKTPKVEFYLLDNTDRAD